ncbi:MAG: DUF1700 domain-containing protein [Lachnospiraceae bacterium]|nr:DUF1700 domain-containing protein [Lachnospiraceae bacterium]
MKEQYMKQAEKELHLPHKIKKDIIRDLNEIFASALENGETEQQVIDRLGTPKEFAASTAEQLEIDFAASEKCTRIISSVLALAVASVAFAIYAIVRAGSVPQGAIGQADAMTNLKIGGTFGMDISAVLLVIGIGAAVAAVNQIIRSIGKNRRYL